MRTLLVIVSCSSISLLELLVMASVSLTGRNNSGSKGYDFATDDILCSYEDYINQDYSNGTRTDPGIGTNSAKLYWSRQRGRSGNDFGLMERLTDILVDDGDGHLLFQDNDREDRVMQWLQALDMQVMGAYRADEILKPFLKLNASIGVANDRLLAHLTQHFEPSKVAMLARCLCVSLVSIRVGKSKKQGTLLFPTSTRHICLGSIDPTEFSVEWT